MAEKEMEIPNTTNGEHINLENTSDVQSQINFSIRSHIDRIKQDSKTLTLEGVQILLEEELELETYALDAHKTFIQECISQYMKETDHEIEVNALGKENAVEFIPDMDNKETVSEAVPTLDMVKDALQKRASYIRLNSETITLAVLRRLLEEDLKLDKMSLDKYKHAIVEEVDKIMKNNKPEKIKSTKTKTKKTKTIKTTPHTESEEDVKESGSTSSGVKSGEEDGEYEEEDEDVKPKKKVAQRVQSHAKEVKKRRGAKAESELPKKRQKKPEKPKLEEKNELEVYRGASEKESSQSSGEKLIKRKESAIPVCGKRVEHLKSVIKLCGISVGPAVYTRVKRAPEESREEFLIMELEDILAREGLSSNPSEKEIKSVKRKKERAKELEGIDMSNIVSSSRRRSTSFLPPLPEPKSSSESEDGEGGLDSEGEGNSDTSDDGDDGHDDDDENEIADPAEEEEESDHGEELDESD